MAVTLGSGIGVSVAVTVDVSVAWLVGVAVGSTVMADVGVDDSTGGTGSVAALLAGRLQAARTNPMIVRKQKSRKEVVRMSPLE